MKFKVGDRVRFIESYSPGDVKARETGVIAREEFSFPNPLVSVCLDSGRELSCFPWRLELVETHHLAKGKPVLYAVFYEKNGVDPLKEFYSRKELNDWLKKASEDRDIRWDSIRVIEKPKFLRVEVSKSFRLKV